MVGSRILYINKLKINSGAVDETCRHTRAENHLQVLLWCRNKNTWINSKAFYSKLDWFAPWGSSGYKTVDKDNHCSASPSCSRGLTWWWYICSVLIIFNVFVDSFQIVLVYNSSEEQLTAIPGTALHWLGGVRPPDVPVCGFKNDNPICLASQWQHRISSQTHTLC